MHTDTVDCRIADRSPLEDERRCYVWASCLGGMSAAGPDGLVARMTMVVRPGIIRQCRRRLSHSGSMVIRRIPRQVSNANLIRLRQPSLKRGGGS